MKEPLNHTATSHWPAWHNQPLHLTVQEIEHPALVLDQFFQCYHLPDIRSCLNNWLQDALAKPTIESKEHVSTHNEMQKLVEAAWLIYQNGTKNYNRSKLFACGAKDINNAEEEDISAEEPFNKPK